MSPGPVSGLWWWSGADGGLHLADGLGLDRARAAARGLRHLIDGVDARICCDSLNADSTPFSISWGDPFGIFGSPPLRRMSRSSVDWANALDPAKLSLTVSKNPGSALETM
jgi:hypothetical protein